LKREELTHWVTAFTYRTLHWGYNRVPLGVRSFIGVLFLIGGMFGFLPVLGFWMIPLGLALIALDLPFTRHKIVDWMHRLKAKLDAANQPTSNQ
jgi:hypothetical protein|tara:strand:- start:3266 stop:3547 length:282 start_codon:yes stop_codon:yes gene_type:complete